MYTHKHICTSLPLSFSLFLSLSLSPSFPPFLPPSLPPSLTSPPTPRHPAPPTPTPPSLSTSTAVKVELAVDSVDLVLKVVIVIKIDEILGQIVEAEAVKCLTLATH